MHCNTFVHCRDYLREPEVLRSRFKVQGSRFKVQGSRLPSVPDYRLFSLLPEPIWNTIRSEWYRASSFSSHAGNRRSTGRLTEAHEDMFTGPQHTLTLRGNLRFQ